MRKVFFMTALLWMGWLRMSADELDGLILFFEDGTSVAYLLADAPKISFSADRLFLQTSDRSVEWPLEEVSRYVLAENVATGISETVGTSFSFVLSGDVLTVNNLLPHEKVEVYFQSGQKVAEAYVGGRDNVRMNLPKQAGVYIIHTAKCNYKIIK